MDFAGFVLNASLDAIETAIGTTPVVKIFTGSKPAIGAANTGTELASMNLPSDWMGDAASAAKALLGTWQDTEANADGVAGYFRLYQSDGTTVGIQGTCGESGSGADMILDNTDIATGQQITVTAFNLSAS